MFSFWGDFLRIFKILVFLWVERSENIFRERTFSVWILFFKIVKLEGDLKKYKIDLQMARNKENELRDQIVSSAASKPLKIIFYYQTI